MDTKYIYTCTERVTNELVADTDGLKTYAGRMTQKNKNPPTPVLKTVYASTMG